MKAPEDCKTAKELAEYYEETKLPIKKVQFSNGRVWRHQRPPFVTGGYRDEVTGMKMRYKDILLYDLNGERAMIPNQDGTMVPRRYEKDIAFLSNAIIEMHPIIHFDVIKAVRNDKDCATPFKGDGYREVNQGKIVEFAPEIMTKKEYESFKIGLDANIVFNALMELQNQKLLEKVLALTNNYKGSKEVQHMDLHKYVQGNPRQFLDYFSNTDPENLDLKQGYVHVAIVKMAIEKKVIKLLNGQYFLGDVPLGVSASKIHIDYEKHMTAIAAELDAAK